MQLFGNLVTPNSKVHDPGHLPAAGERAIMQQRPADDEQPAFSSCSCMQQQQQLLVVRWTWMDESWTCQLSSVPASKAAQGR